MNVLLVDDYPLLLEGLVQSVPWADCGCEVVGVARNGRQALDFIQGGTVDILLTDIKMPVMDGLELIRRVRGQGRTMKIAVLSAYDDFPLVREAFQLGADDYVRKQEMDTDAIVPMLERFSGELRVAWSQRSSHAPPLPDEPSERLPAGEAIVPAEGMAMMLFVIETADERDDAELFFGAVEREIRRMVEREWDGGLYLTNYNEYAIAFRVREGRSLREAGRSLYAALERQAANGSLGVLTAVVGWLDGGFDASLARHRRACAHRHQVGRGRLLFTEDLADRQPPVDLEIGRRVASLERALADATRLDAAWDQWQLPEGGGLIAAREQIDALYMRYAWAMIQHVEAHNLALDCERWLATLRLVQGGGTIRELNAWLREALEQIQARSEAQNRHVAAFRRYIQDNYGQSALRGEDVASHLGISVGHMGKLIYREMGCHFSDYLNAYRIERAKEFLKTTNMKVYEVAYRVGYGSVEHFTRVFKRIVGVNPTRYVGGGKG